MNETATVLPNQMECPKCMAITERDAGGRFVCCNGHEFAGPTTSEPSRHKALSDRLLAAAICCGHTITDDAVVLRGRKHALAELHERLHHELVRSLPETTTGPTNGEPKADMVNHPPHYTAGTIECITAIESATSGLSGIEAVCVGAAIKYLWRWKGKGGIDDLRKSVWYINHLIRYQEEFRNLEQLVEELVK